MRRVLWLFCLIFSFGNAELKINVLDATVKDKNLSGVEVIFQKQGESSIKAITNENGEISIPQPFGKDNADITMILKKSGYATLSVKCPCDGFVYAMSPVLKGIDSLRVVLQWGKEPRDMDLHAYWGNLNQYDYSKHIYWRKANRDGGNSPIWLDVDDVNGYGPETITLNKREDGKEYVFFVHRYAGMKMNTQRAKELHVFVYIGSSLIRKYDLPQNLAQSMGAWIPFVIDKEGKIVDKNVFVAENEIASKGFGYDYAGLLKLANQRLGGEYVPQISSDDKKNAKRLNQLGEKAYHSKDYAQSIEYYLQSISLNPSNGQVYSNLGLSYQKVKNYAEAVWANRKAIELASGKNASTIRANSYYNIAKMYEEKGELQEALTNYQRAFDNKNKETYTEAINRIKGKLNQ